MALAKPYHIHGKISNTKLKNMSVIDDKEVFRYTNENVPTLSTCFNDWTNNLMHNKMNIQAAQGLVPFTALHSSGDCMYIAGMKTTYDFYYTLNPYYPTSWLTTDISTSITTTPPSTQLSNPSFNNDIAPTYFKSLEYDSVSGLSSIKDIIFYLDLSLVLPNDNTIYLIKDDMFSVASTATTNHLKKVASDELYTINYIRTHYNIRDGEYSSSNKRKEFFTPYTPSIEYYAKFHDNNTVTSYKNSIPLFELLTNPFISGARSNRRAYWFSTPNLSSGITPLNTFPLYLQKYNFISKYKSFVFSSINPENYDTVSEKMLKISENSTIAYTKQGLCDLFGLLGFYVTFSLNEAQEKNTSEFEYKPSDDLPLPTPPNIGGGEDPENPEGGGDGVVDDTKDPIEDGDHSTGVSELSSSYLINYTQLKLLQENFNDASKWTDISRWFYEPSSAVINILRFPFDVSKFQPSSQINAQDIAIMGRTLEQDGITINGYKLLRNAITRIPMGSINIQEYYGTFLDYDPYTKISVYLPYFGFFNISAMNTIGKTLTCWYNVSYTDGSAIATLESDGVPIYIFKGQLGYLVPMCKTDALQKQQDRIMNAIAGSTSILSQGASGVASAVSAGATGGSVGASAGISGAGMAQTAMNTASSLVSKTSVIASGTTEGQHSRALTNKPYMIIERPVTSMPSNYGGIRGYQCNLYGKLSEFKGYTVCDNVKLDGIFALDSEKERLKTLLCKGVIL